jgi:hypothetical protein
MDPETGHKNKLLLLAVKPAASCRQNNPVKIIKLNCSSGFD